jgi:N-acetyl-gamma-glutamyl-phosphate reductase
MTLSVFVDGSAGTTGLEILDRLADRPEIALRTLPDALRKDTSARADALASADFVVLCLPDDAAREAVALVGGAATRIVDASTAHRTAAGWDYGFPELNPGQRAKIVASSRVSNPGCYPTAFLSLVAPLVREGLIDAAWPWSVNATSGYSGGGKSMIAAFEDADAPGATDAGFRIYGLDMAHKHVPEMQVHAGLANPPLFSPAVARSYRGMIVEVPVPTQAASGSPDRLREALADAYAGSPLITVATRAESAALGVLRIEQVAGTDRIEIHVFGNATTGQARLVAAIDNLGKGAAGAAVQSLNLMAGLPETAGLRL